MPPWGPDPRKVAQATVQAAAELAQERAQRYAHAAKAAAQEQIDEARRQLEFYTRRYNAAVVALAAPELVDMYAADVQHATARLADTVKHNG